ncbi:hypothetical protein ACMGD3_12960 [Lysinibacillus sphaericus]
MTDRPGEAADRTLEVMDRTGEETDRTLEMKDKPAKRRIELSK